MTRRAAVCGLVLAAAVLAGCGQDGAAAPSQPVQVASAGVVGPATAGVEHRDRNRGGGDDGGSTGAGAPATVLPADWPKLPLPAGSVTGATGAGSSWTVQLRLAGSADEVRRRTEAFYAARGFATTGTPDVLVRGALRLVVVAENRDHSATSSTLVLGVERR